MFSHVMLGSNDIARSKTFYDAPFATIGGKPGTVDAKGRLIYAHRGGRLMLTPPIDGGTIGFTAESAEEGESWHKVAVENGGISIEDPPGVRQGATGSLHLAYVRDPNGNKLRALHRMTGNSAAVLSGSSPIDFLTRAGTGGYAALARQVAVWAKM
jgi:catechol 2,3-dioxygenase-like lactoylglutathione lyase family enzyme